MYAFIHTEGNHIIHRASLRLIGAWRGGEKRGQAICVDNASTCLSCFLLQGASGYKGRLVTRGVWLQVYGKLKTEVPVHLDKGWRPGKDWLRGVLKCHETPAVGHLTPAAISEIRSVLSKLLRTSVF